MRYILRRLNGSLAAALLVVGMLAGCGRASRPGTPIVGFLDFVEDDTLAIVRRKERSKSFTAAPRGTSRH
jgi:hypothetical protein